MACLLALEQYQDCLSLVTKEVKLGTTNADVFILRARLYNFFQKVEQGGWGRGGPPPVWVPPAYPEITPAARVVGTFADHPAKLSGYHSALALGQACVGSQKPQGEKPVPSLSLWKLEPKGDILDQIIAQRMISQCGKQHRVGAPKDPLDKVAFVLLSCLSLFASLSRLRARQYREQLGDKGDLGSQERRDCRYERTSARVWGTWEAPDFFLGAAEASKGCSMGQWDLERSFGYQGESGWRDKSGGQEPDAVQPERRAEARMAVRGARKGPVPQSFGSQEQRQMGKGREREGSRTVVGVRAWPGARELGNSGGRRGK